MVGRLIVPILGNNTRTMVPGYICTIHLPPGPCIHANLGKNKDKLSINGADVQKDRSTPNKRQKLDIARKQ